jgi:DNA-binding protein H-NS
MSDIETQAARKLAAIRTIRKLMDFWSISPRELGRGSSHPTYSASIPKNSIRYRHPVSGEEWNGIGRQPDWLRNALLKEGFTVEEIRVDQQQN